MYKYFPPLPPFFVLLSYFCVVRSLLKDHHSKRKSNMYTPIPTNRPDLYTVEEVAHKLRVTPATVRNMIKDNRLHAIKTSQGRGVYRIPVAALDALLGNGAPTENRFSNS